MAFVNSVLKELHFKAVYAGPPRSGKTASLQRIAARSFPEKTFFTFLDSAGGDSTGAFRERAKEARPGGGEKPIRIPLLIVNIGTVLGHKTFFHALSLSSTCDDEEKQALLQGADGIVFVADSHPEAERENKKALSFLETRLQKPDLFKIPLTLQYNKRDLEPKIPLEVLRAGLNKYNSKDFESAVAAPPVSGSASAGDDGAGAASAAEASFTEKTLEGGAGAASAAPTDDSSAGAVATGAGQTGDSSLAKIEAGGRGGPFAPATAPFKHICRLILADMKSIDLP